MSIHRIPSPPHSTSSSVLSSQSHHHEPTTTTSTTTPQTLEHYIHYTTKAAELAREAILSVPRLEQELSRLSSELQVWKLGHHEANQRARDAQKKLDAGDDMVYVALDGDGVLFHRSLIQKGRDGGREAALSLRQNITEYAETQGISSSQTLTVVITLFLSKSGLAKVLNNVGIADESTFNAFLQGLNAAHPLIQVVDVGPQKEAADAKLRENIKLYAKLPSCRLVLAGCCHDGGYAHLFTSIQTENPLVSHKLRLLQSYSLVDTAFELKRLNLPTVEFEGLFEKRKLNYNSNNGGGYSNNSLVTNTPKKGGNSTMTTNTAMMGFNPSTSTSTNVNDKKPFNKKNKLVSTNSYNGQGYDYHEGGGGGDGNITKTSRSKSSGDGGGGFTKVIKLRPVDPKKPFNKQDPPLCNQHYLSPPCPNGDDDCRYGHCFSLTTQQLIQLRSDAKKSPCIYALKGKGGCNDPNCCLGHVCPRGKSCKYGTSCRFSAPGMHPPGTPGRSDGWAWKLDQESIAMRIEMDSTYERLKAEHEAKKKSFKKDKKKIKNGKVNSGNSKVEDSLTGGGGGGKFFATLGGMTVLDYDEDDTSGYETTSSVD